MKRLLTLVAGLLLGAPVFAQEPPPAPPAPPAAPAVDPIVKKIAEKLPTLANLKWEAVQTLAFDANDATGKGTISTSFQDKTHFKCSLDFVAGPKAAEGETAETQNIKATVVADGTYLWISSPMLLQTQMFPENVKVELSVFTEILAVAGPMMGGMAPGPLDLSGLMTKAADGMTFKEEGSTEALSRYVFSGQGWNGAMKMDAATWFPMGVEVANEEGMKVTMNTTSFSKKESFAEGFFALSGVDVATVMDLSGMIRSQLAAFSGAGAGGDEDLEF